MKLEHDDIEEFKNIYRKEFGEQLSDAAAREMASRVVRLYEVLLDIAERMAALEKDASAAKVKAGGAPASPGRHITRNENQSHAL